MQPNMKTTHTHTHMHNPPQLFVLLNGPSFDLALWSCSLPADLSAGQ